MTESVKIGGVRWQPSLLRKVGGGLAAKLEITSELIDDWRQLSRQALDVTALNGPEGLLKPLAHIAGPSARLVAARDPATGTLLALAGLGRSQPLGGLTGGVPKIWASEFGPLGTPLLSAQSADAAAEALLRTVFDETRTNCLSLPDQMLDSPSFEAIERAAAELGLAVTVVGSWERAVLRPAATAPGELHSPLSGKHRKDLRRRLRRLSEHGPVELKTASSAVAIDRALAAFFEIELGGWKGGRRTALASTAERRAYAENFLRGFAATGGLTIDTLWVGDRAVASLILVAQGRHAVTWKIAFDEAYGRYSPGVLLVQKTTERLLRERRFDLIDSLATPDHSMINRIWPDRMRVGDILIGRNRHVLALRALEVRLLRAAKAAAKDVKDIAIRSRKRRS